ncbi:MAG: inositol monophosphatase family protein [Chloroflexota bacterium]
MTADAPASLTAPGAVPAAWPADDAGLAAMLAAGAGRVLLELRAHVDEGTFPGDLRGLKDAGDLAAQTWLADALAHARPGDAVLSEEARDDRSRLDADRTWIIDPLDGTREFAERDEAGTGWRTDFAVHVALWVRGRGLVAGAVGLPARNLVRRSDQPLDVPAERYDDILAGRRPLRLAVSRTRPPAVAARLGAREDVELVPMGSNGVKVMAVLDGTADVYVHAGGQYEWDSAAPVAVATAAGLTATRLDGSPLLYNQPDPWSPDLAVCHPALVAHLRRLLAGAGADDEPGARP